MSAIRTIRSVIGMPFVVLGIALLIFGSVIGGIGEWGIKRLDDVDLSA